MSQSARRLGTKCPSTAPDSLLQPNKSGGKIMDLQYLNIYLFDQRSKSTSFLLASSSVQWTNWLVLMHCKLFLSHFSYAINGKMYFCSNVKEEEREYW